MPVKYLVFGSGLLGSAFVQYPDAVVLSKNQCDITNVFDIKRALNSFAPEVVINCAGIVPRHSADVAYMFKVNSFAPHVIAEECHNRCRFVHISTNCVFDGERTSYSERDAANAVDPYGVSKKLGEPEDALVIRTSFIGLPDPKGRGLLAWVKNQTGKVVGYDKVLWNGLTVPVLIDKIFNLVNQGLVGNIHLHGFTYSKYDVLCKANSILFDNRLDIIMESDTTDTPHIEHKTLMSLRDGYIRIPLEKQLQELYDDIKR